jgi:hypothetical protein
MTVTIIILLCICRRYLCANMHLQLLEWLMQKQIIFIWKTCIVYGTKEQIIYVIVMI